MSYCENGINKDNSIFCNLLKDNCTYIRWCYNSQCIKNTDGYINCKVRSGEMSKNKKVNIEITPTDVKEIDYSEEVIQDVDNQEDFKEEYCKVIWIKEKGFGIEFKDFGLSVHTENLIDKEKIPTIIKIKYKGQIGDASFEYHPVYE